MGNVGEGLLKKREKKRGEKNAYIKAAATKYLHELSVPMSLT